jgi:DNA gyrase/topoisomerase IV subunit B
MAPKELGEKYKKHELRDHIFNLPDTYAGSSEPQSLEVYLFSDASGSMERRAITFVPALYKCFDEILVNALDHATRVKSSGEEDARAVRTIKVNIDKAAGVVEVFNDGDGVEVEKHPQFDIYVPELIFGELLTSANYDKDEEKVVGGKNGVGAKLTNIFSKEFSVETLDHRRHRLYKQTWRENMTVREAPAVRAAGTKAAPYTRVRFRLDFGRFGEQGMTDDLFDLFRRRTMDAGACTDANVSVFFNDAKLEYKDLEHYADLFIGKKDERPRAYEACGEGDRRWEVLATYSDGGQFEQTSFVNGINTLKGGRHVDHVVGQIARRLADMVSAKKKKEVRPQHIRDNLMVFVKAVVVNPTFDSQTKETLTTAASKLGTKCELSDKFMDKLYKAGVADRAVSLTDFHDHKKLAKTDGKKSTRVLVPKLDDANRAGTKDSAACTLILTEGDSAKTMAISGLSVVGRDYYGVFPLRGKILNVREANVKKIAENEEISNLKKILGLEQNKDYKDLSSLRYGRILIMTDADSVAADTPLLLRDAEGRVAIRTIDDIAVTDWAVCGDSGKEYALTRFEAWTEAGWTPIKHVMRHKVTKRMFRVVSHTGAVDVTEDHSLLNPTGEKVSPKDLKIGHELLHAFPRFARHVADIPKDLEPSNKAQLCEIASRAKVPYYQKYLRADLAAKLASIRDMPTLQQTEEFVIDPREAYAMGLFFADGSCGVYQWEVTTEKADRPRAYTYDRTSVAWAITNNNLAFLEKAKAALETRYAFEFVIIPDRASAELGHPDHFKLVVNGGDKTRAIVEWYRALFYDDNKKKRVPLEILNGTEEVRRLFFEGFYDGDGDKSGCSLRFDFDGKIGAMGMFYLCSSLGYSVSINIRTDKMKVYCLNLTRPGGHQQANPNMVKKIIDLGVTEQYVYDLETENHHFHAGVGQLIVHNTDGSHIKGLLFNVFQSLWPSLFRMDGFLASLQTPIVKATHPRDGTVVFYNLDEFEAWRRGRNLRGWTFLYLKGLGSSSAADAKEYFRTMKTLTYGYTGAASDAAIDLAFNKKRADDRKAWLMRYDRHRQLDYKTLKRVPYETFIEDEFVHYSNRDLERSIPKLVDGLKESQRKILYGCFKKKLHGKEIKVAQLAGYISEVSAYHHGETSLQQAIIGLAQDYVGANNVHLLEPVGQFGTRIQGGGDAASPRYIYTKLSPLARLLFPEDDDAVLTYLDDDGVSVEPQYYVPIVPFVLINGGLGIGTGFSTNVPSHNPAEVTEMCLQLAAAVDAAGVQVDDKPDLLRAFEALDGCALRGVRPFHLGFEGAIVPHKEGAAGGTSSYASRGLWRWNSNDTLEVSELPVGTWTEDFKDMLTSMLLPPGGHALLKDYENHYTDRNVRFVLKFHPGKRIAVTDRVLETEFKLLSTKGLSYANLHLYSAEGAIARYRDAHHVAREHAKVRLATYLARKQAQLQRMGADHELASAKVRFIQDVVDGRISVMDRKERELHAQLEGLRYPKLADIQARAPPPPERVAAEAADAVAAEIAGMELDDSAPVQGSAEAYGYLTHMPIRQLTHERKNALEKEAAELLMRMEQLRKTSIQQLWRNELQAFHDAWAKHAAQAGRDGAAAVAAMAAMAAPAKGAKRRKLT